MARRYNLGKPYTQEEIDLILLTPKRNLSLLAEKLGRNAETIRRKRWKLEHEEQVSKTCFDISATMRKITRDFEKLSMDKNISLKS